VQQICSPNREIFLLVHQRQGPSTWPRGWRGGRGVDAGGDLDGDSPPCPSAAWEYQARLPRLTRVRGPRRFGGSLTQKPCENSNLAGMLWVGDKDEERRRRVGYKSLEAYLEEKFPDSRRKAYYLMSIRDQLAQIPAPEIEELGWSKALELAKVARSEGRRFDCATWLHRAQEST